MTKKILNCICCINCARNRILRDGKIKFRIHIMEKTIAVDVHRFIPPRGMRVVSRVILCATVENKYQEILESGCRITSEKFMTGETSLTIEEPDLGDFVIRFIKLSLDTDTTLTKMIQSFKKEEFEKWKRQRLQNQ